MAGSDLRERLLVHELLIGGWQLTGPGRLPTFAEEPFDTRRPEEQEDAGLVRIDMEPVRDTPRAMDERARNRFDHILTVLDTHLPGEDHEELIFLSMDMERRCESLGRQQLHRGESPLRLV